ncbi:hypothetical protein LTR85_006298 [Meristemomyces frigidus]|nr:hypothetical protein LTR85_006298 [Meristemomyces frigidus]
MSLTFKLLSLAIRTAAKPIGNYIKRQAKEHDGFRRFAVTQAQRVHRVDMRMRLGILHDADAQQRMHEREQRAAEEKKRKQESTPTVRTAEEQQKYDEEQAKDGEKPEEEKKQEKRPKVKIRPLSEAKAIELGANFFSEAFIFAVAAGLLVWDSMRNRAKESARRDDVAERLNELEEEVARLRIKVEPELAVLSEKVRRVPEREYGWYNPAGWFARSEPVTAEGEEPPVIPGNVPGPPPEKAIKPTPAPKAPTKPPAPAAKNGDETVKTSADKPKAAEVPGEKPRERIDSVTESQLSTHDVSIPLSAVVDSRTGNALSTRHLRLLLLSRSAVAETKLDDTIKRIQHFASLTGGQDLAIVFLLAAPPAGSTFVSAKQLAVDTSSATASNDDTEGVYAYTRLQAVLVNHADIPNLPILPLADLEGLAALLKKHVANFTRARTPQAQGTTAVATPFELLQVCTANPPMSQQTAYVLSDLFANIKELAEACTSVTSAPNSSSPSARAAALAGLGGVSSQMDDPYGPSTQETGLSDGAQGKLKKLRDLVGEQQCMDVVDFWREEWTVD